MAIGEFDLPGVISVAGFVSLAATKLWAPDP